MLARLLLITLFVCPVIGGCGVGYALNAGYGLLTLAAGLFGAAMVALTMDVFPGDAS